MAYMIRLTAWEATCLGATGIASLGIGVGLMKLSQLIDGLGRKSISDSQTENPERPLDHEITSSSGTGTRALTISSIGIALLNLLVLLFWFAGTGFVTYAVVGPFLI